MYKRLKNFLFTNSNTKQTIIKNTVWLFIGEFFGRVVKLFLVIYATRALGAEGWGVFSYGLAFVSLFYIFADIGINTFITRELSKEKDNRYEYIPSALVLKLSLLAVSFVISLLLIPQLGSNLVSINLVLTLALLNFSDSIREFILSINRAFQKMEREAFIKIVLGGITAVLGVALLSTTPSPLSLAIAYATGSIIASIFSFFSLSHEIKTISWVITTKQIKTILHFAWPFIASVIFSTALVTIDTIMLGQLKSASEVGLYSAAQRVIQLLAVIPLFIGISLFPLMSRNSDDITTINRIFEKTMVTVLAIGIPLAIGGLLVSDKLILLLFGTSFAQGGIVLGILMFVILADFPYIILNNIITAKGLQRKFIISTIIGLVINIILNLYFIPLYGAVGAAISTLVAQMIIMVINWQLLKRFMSFSIVTKLGKIITATIIMGVIIFLSTILRIPVLITIVLAATTYTYILYFLKEPSLQLLLSTINKK